MPRKQRINEIGFYHIINRGVEKRIIFYDDKDFYHFLSIINDSSTIYNFSIYSFALMSNHYHLLIKTNEFNVSIIMKQISSRYSFYFNKKYKRVGPLWQSRFKSFFVYDEHYLQYLIRYIEFNPLNANLSKKIGAYKYAMSSRKISFKCFDFELLDKVDLNKPSNKEEVKELTKFLNSKVELKLHKVVIKNKKSLKDIFSNTNKTTREIAISNSLKERYTGIEIANFLSLSTASISKIYNIYKKKIALFEQLKTQGIFWSYSKNINYDTFNVNIFIEHILKYADFDDITLGINLFGKRLFKKVWHKQVKQDKQFIKINLMIARVFFNMDITHNYFKKVKNERFEKLKLLTS